MKSVLQSLFFVVAFLFAGNASAAANRILACAGVNQSVRGCNGHIRLYLSETDSGEVRAMLYSWTIMNSSQTWRADAGFSTDAATTFKGSNRAGGKIALSVDYTRAKTLKVSRPGCFPEAVRNLEGHPAKLNYEAVYKPYLAPEKRETGKNVSLVCKPL